MSAPLYVVDAFADRPFAGNPAAVVPLDDPPAENWMKRIALEMNLSETAFVWPEVDGFRLRWLTPAVEVDLCGHATLAASHVLWETGRVKRESPIRFHTRSGALSAAISGELIELDFPAKPATMTAPDPAVLAALGTTAIEYGLYGTDALVVVETELQVVKMTPDFRKLAAVGVRGVIVTAKSNTPDRDFVSRFFGPGVGIDEDPVTGSAHCCLGPYWGQQLGKKELIGYQASPRGGTVRVRLVGDRAMLGGRAFTIVRGEIVV